MTGLEKKMARKDNRKRYSKRQNKRNQAQGEGEAQGQAHGHTQAQGQLHAAAGTARPASPARATPTQHRRLMETSSAPRTSHDNALEAAQRQLSTPQGLAVSLTPEYDPSLPPPANSFSSLSTTERLGFLSPAEYLAQAFASETANASTLLPLAGYTDVFVDAYTPLDVGENLFQDLDPVADKARLFNIVSGFVARDGREARTPDVVNQEMEKETILVTKKVVGKWKGSRGKRGGAKHKGKKSNPSVFAKLDDPSKIEKAAGRVVGGDGGEKDHGAFDDTQEFLLTEIQEEENDGDEAAAEKKMSVKNKRFDPEAKEFQPGF